MAAIPSITRWDAIDGKDLVLYVDPGFCPTGSGWTANGLYLKRGQELVHLSDSRKLVERLSSRKTIIVVEADERSYRITRIGCTRIGLRT
tara:strand:- start:368 stop:637 length:270 start_codon:yes stop_codon:yes gene_type:complete